MVLFFFKRILYYVYIFAALPTVSSLPCSMLFHFFSFSAIVNLVAKFAKITLILKDIFEDILCCPLSYHCSVLTCLSDSLTKMLSNRDKDISLIIIYWSQQSAEIT